MRDGIRYTLAIDDGFPVECKQGCAQFCVNSLQTDLHTFAENGDGDFDSGVLLPSLFLPTSFGLAGHLLEARDGSRSVIRLMSAFVHRAGQHKVPFYAASADLAEY
jgi:hypothetical protein